MATQTDQASTIVPHEVTLDLYRKMLRVYYVDERMKIFARQGKCTFHASARGHEKIQIGMTLLLRPRHDWFFTYYRESDSDRSRNAVEGCLPDDAESWGDPNSNGRNMAEHFSSRSLTSWPKPRARAHSFCRL